MKKYFIRLCSVLIVILFSASLVMLYRYRSEIKNYRNIMILESSHGITRENLESVKDYIKVTRSVSALSFYSISQESLSSEHRNVGSVENYKVDKNYKLLGQVPLISGRFIDEREFSETSKAIVIDKSTALELFDTYNAVGKKVYISNVEYTIIGICDLNNNFIKRISKTSKNIVFTPAINNANSYALERSFLLFKFHPGANNIFEKSTVENIQAILGNEVFYRNLGYDADKLIEKITLVFWFLIIVILVNYIKYLWRYVRKVYEDIKNILRTRYLAKALQKKVGSIIFIVTAVLLLIILFKTAVKLLPLNLYVNPKIVPRQLIDLDQWKENIYTYFYEKNSRRNIINNSVFYINNLTHVINYLGIISIGSYIYIIKLLKSIPLTKREGTSHEA